jgi:hypothetical protein
MITAAIATVEAAMIMRSVIRCSARENLSSGTDFFW